MLHNTSIECKDIISPYILLEISILGNEVQM